MLVNTLLETCDRRPDHLAVADATRPLSYRQVVRLATVLRGIVERRSSCGRVGVLLPASSIFPPTLYGVLWASRVVVPLNFLLTPEELAEVVVDAQLDLILTVTHFRKLADQLPADKVYLDKLGLARRVLFAGFRRMPAAPRVEPDDTAVILYTSGTTAQPKGVELTHRNLSSNCADTIAALDIDPSQQFVNILPPFHVFGLTASVLMPVQLGASVFAIPRFNAVAVIRAVAERKATLLIAIPSMYAAMLRTKSATREMFESVTQAVSGGEPLPPSVRDGFADRFGVSLWEGYGLTETAPVLCVGTHAAHRDGTVGKPIPHVELRITDDEGRPCEAGTEGAIHARGPGIMKGYYRQPEATGEVLDRDGWFATGDIGAIDGDGFLSITGRAKEMLIIGGENVFPREIESVLEQHHGVLQAAVIGIPDELRGEAPVAFVLPVEGAEISEPELRSFAKKSLAGFKVPKRISVRSDLPVTATGKILKRSLKGLLE